MAGIVHLAPAVSRHRDEGLEATSAGPGFFRRDESSVTISAVERSLQR